MTDQLKCLDCQQTGHAHWECKDPDVLAKRQTYWSSRKTHLDSFDKNADELKFQADNTSLFDW